MPGWLGIRPSATVIPAFCGAAGLKPPGGLDWINEIEAARFALLALTEKLSAILANAFLVSVLTTADLDRGIAIAVGALEIVAKLAVLHR